MRSILLAIGILIFAVSTISAEPAHNVDTLRPKTCIPGFKLFFSRDEKTKELVLAQIANGTAKPDAILERYDASQKVAYVKRIGGRTDFVRLSDPTAQRWIVVYEGTPVDEWKTSWDAFTALAENHLNHSKPGALGPWEGKEVTWEGTVAEIENISAKSLIRLTFAMPDHTLNIKGSEVSAARLTIFVPIDAEHFRAGMRLGEKLKFKTILAPIDDAHPSTEVKTVAKEGKTVLIVNGKDGTILKERN